MNLVSNNIAEIVLVRQWSCYRNLYSKQYRALKLQFYPLVTLNIGITVGPKNPLYYYEMDQVTPEMLKPYPMIMYDYMDSGPYSDIFDRLKLAPGKSRFVTSSRAAIYETITHSDAYYLNSD